MLVGILIGGMIMALMAINYFVASRHFGDTIADPEEKLREEVEHGDRVISRRSVFHDFLVRDSRASCRHGRARQASR